MSVSDLKSQLEDLNSQIRLAQLNETFESRAACVTFIRSTFGLKDNKHILFTDGYRSSNSVFMRCEGCEDFHLEARFVGKLFRF